MPLPAQNPTVSLEASLPEGVEGLSGHDLHILRLAAGTPEGRIAFGISPEGSTLLLPGGGQPPVAAEEAFPRLEDLGYLKRVVPCSYVLMPAGWDLVMGEGNSLLLPGEEQVR